jgi:hypothetical protein
MKNRRVRIALLLFACGLLVAATGFAQKANEWAIQNAMIGPNSPIEIRAGSYYNAQVMYPVPDGPLFALKASVTWRIEPAMKGISIDEKSGKITVDADVPQGATTNVHANVDGGRRKLEARLFIFRPEDNPLIGKWHVDTRVTCGDTEEMKAPAVRPLSLRDNDWKFHVNQQFWVGREMSIRAGVRLSGSYELDLKAAKLKLLPTWPKKPVSTWNYSLKNDGKTLLLRPLEPQEDLEAECGYVLLR